MVKDRVFIDALMIIGVLVNPLIVREAISAENDLGCFFKGYSYMQQGNYEKAIGEFQRSIQDNPEHAPSYTNLALCLERQDAYDDAEHIWGKYVTMNATYAEQGQKHLYLLKEAKKVRVHLQDNGKTEEVLDILVRISKDTYPGSGICIWALHQLGHYYYSQGKYAEAIDTYEALIRQFGMEDLNRINCMEFADALLCNKKYEKALEIYTTISNGELNDDEKFQVLYGMGLSLFNLNKYLQSIRAFEQFLEKDTNSMNVPIAIHNIGIAARNTGQSLEVLSILNRFCETFPANNYIPVALYEISRCQEEAKKYNEALTGYQDIIERYPNSELVESCKFRMALLYQVEDRYEDSIQRFQEFLDYYPNSKERDMAMFYLAEACLMKAKKGKDISQYDLIVQNTWDIIGKFPETEAATKAYYLLYRCYQEQGEYTKRDKAFLDYLNKGERYYKQEEMSKITKEIADEYVNKGNYSRAVMFYNLLIEKFKNNELIEESIFSLGKCYEGLCNYENALIQYRKLINRTLKSKRGPILEAMGDIFRKQENLEQAKGYYLNAGESFSLNKEYDRAIDVYKIIINYNLHSNDIGDITCLIARNYQKKGEHQKAIEGLITFAKKHPRNNKVPEAYLLIAVSYMAKQEYANAINILQQLLKDYSQHSLAAWARYVMGYIYISQQEYEQAKIQFQSILRNHPQSEYLSWAGRILQSLDGIGKNEVKGREKEQALRQ